MLLYLSLKDSHAAKQYKNFIVSTDSEPDDFVANIALIDKLNIKNEHAKITFVVGEGNAAIKALNMKNMIAAMRQDGLLGENIETSIIRGYDSSKVFEKSGLLFYQTQTDLNQALIAEGYDAKETPETRKKTCEEITKALQQSDDSTVILLKPGREFLDIKEYDVYKNATLIVSGSFNVRALFQKARDKEAIKEQLFMLFNAFRKVIYVEAYPATGKNNAYNNENAPDIFKQISPQTQWGSVFYRLQKAWDEHIRNQTANEIAVLAHDGAAAEIRSLFLQAHTPPLENQLLRLLESTNASELNGIKRAIQLWKSISKYEQQFIISDFLAVAVLFDENIGLQVTPSWITFDNTSDYTVYGADEKQTHGAHVHVVTPEGFSPKQTGHCLSPTLNQKAECAKFNEQQQSVFKKLSASLQETLSASNSVETKYSVSVSFFGKTQPENQESRSYTLAQPKKL